MLMVSVQHTSGRLQRAGMLPAVVLWAQTADPHIVATPSSFFGSLLRTTSMGMCGALLNTCPALRNGLELRVTKGLRMYVCTGCSSSRCVCPFFCTAH
jgi:hypothetical protein